MSAAQQILPVSVLDGKYALLLELGSGGTGTVYEAENIRLGRKLALRSMNPALFSEADSRARFVTELRAAARVSHVNVADIRDLGISRNGVPYIVMDLLRGETLQDIIDMRGPLALGYALELFLQVLAGLSAAHALGVVHSDLKPANVLVTQPRAGRTMVKLLDLGVARGVEAAHRLDPVVTGTPMFMAPEQTLGTPVDCRTDVYQACATLFAVLAGSPPFQASSTRELLKLVAQGKAKDLKQLAPELPDELIAIIRDGMALERKARIQSAEELAERLRPFMSSPARLLALPTTRPTASAVIVTPEAARTTQAQAVVIPVRMPRGTGVSDALLVSPRIPRAPSPPKLRPGRDFMPMPGDPGYAELVAARRSQTRGPGKRGPRFGRELLPGLVSTAIGFGLGVALALAAGLL